jgi:hypothetical protein
LTVQNKATTLFSGKQFGSAMFPALKAGSLSFNLLSEMTSAAFSKETNQVAQNVSNLQNPFSPSALSFVPSKKTIEERLFDATASVKILTAQVAMHMDKKWRDRLFSQVDSLHDLDDWDTDDKPIKKSSFATFLKAILQIKPQRQPGLGLSYEGYLIAAWTIGQDRLTTEFLTNDRVRWVLNCNLDGEAESASGETPVSRLYECLIPYHPDHWFLREEN